MTGGRDSGRGERRGRGCGRGRGQREPTNQGASTAALHDTAMGRGWHADNRINNLRKRFSQSGGTGRPGLGKMGLRTERKNYKDKMKIKVEKRIKKLEKIPKEK